MVANPLEQPTLERLRTRTSMKWREYDPDVLPLWVAELDVDLAEPVADAIIAAVRAGDTGYAAGTAYAEALAGFAERRWGWSSFPVGRSALVPDVMMGIVEVLKLVTGAGDAVVITPPVYPPFYAFVEHADRRVVEAPLGPDGRLDPAALDDAFGRARTGGGVGGRSPVFLLCNPQNPTGTVPTTAELETVAALAERHGVVVVADEIHAPLVLPGAGFVPWLSVAGASRAFALTSASKGWNLAGLKAALLTAGAGAADDLARLPEEVGHGPSHVGVLAHTAAVTDGEPWLDALLAGLDANRTLLGALLADHLPSVRWTPPEATFLAWLDCRATGLADGDAERAAGRGEVALTVGAAAAFLARSRVALSAGSAFGDGGAGHVRLNFGTSSSILREAVTRMATAL